MANKLIIDNKTDLSEKESLELVYEVVKMGKISKNNTMFCYGSTIFKNGIEYGIWSNKNRRSDKFTITRIR